LIIFKFDFVKIVDIKINKQSQYNIKTNLSIYNSYPISTFIANLENDKNCKIDILNEIMISNIKKNIELMKKNYYTIIDNDKKNICSKIYDIYEIIITYISFYISIICFSIITMSIIVNYFDWFDYYINYNNQHNQNIDKINDMNIEFDNKKEKILNDYICV